MDIFIRVIDHNTQRYNTIGDWQYDKLIDVLTIYVSKQACHQYEASIAVHELVEALLCINDGVSQKLVDAFDMALSDEDLEDEEPGDMLGAPYAHQHCIATGIERLMIACFGLKWKPYDEGIIRLCQNYKKGGA